MYRRLFSLLLRRVSPERAHGLGVALLRLVFALPLVGTLLARALRPRGPAVRALGLDFPGPLGLAAGFDKDARAYRALLGLGFSFVEIGTVTPRPQPGNPRPRLFRLPADRALLNRLGFNNQGAVAAAARLGRRRGGIVGVNLGKNKDTPEEGAVADYVCGAERLGPLADYVVVNVSSPNTPGLRDLQSTERLRPILAAVREALDRISPGRRVPLLVKIAPDLADEDLDAVADLARELALDGIVATNTTVSRAGLATPGVEALGPGGISGPPLAARSLAVLARLRARVPAGMAIISVGGIETAEDARARLAAGATLIQAYTGFVYGGPGWPSQLQRALAHTPASG